MRAPRVLLLGAAFQGAVGLALALDASNASGRAPSSLHAVALATALGLVALALLLALLPAYTGREAAGAPLAWAAVGLLPIIDLLAVVLGALGEGALALPLLLALPLVLLRGPLVPGHEPPFAGARPHRVGDRVALAALLAGALGLLAGALLLLLAPRGIPVTGLAVLLLAGLLPTAAGVLAFLLPRLSRVPLQGATLLAIGLGALLLATLALAVAFALPGAGGFRYPAAVVLLAEVLALVAFLRAPLPAAVEGPVRHARPLLRASAVLGPLAGLALLLSLLTDLPGDLLPLAAYAHAALATLLLAAALHLAAPFLGLLPGGRAGWSKTGAAVLIGGLFLLSPSFQGAQSAFPGTLALSVGALLVAVPLLAPSRPGRVARRRKR